MSYTVEAVFSPLLYPHKLTEDDFVVVVVDILRATTSICAALEHGVEKIIPVSGMQEAEAYKAKGFMVACERNGQVMPFADIGNSASDFLDPALQGRTIAFSTTNGTQAVNIARADADGVIIGSFGNISAVKNWCVAQNKNVVILCAAWKNLFNLEDSLFAGALSEMLLEHKNYDTGCDSVKGGIDLWHNAKADVGAYLSKCSHRSRLKHLVSDNDYLYTVTQDSNNTMPVVVDDHIIDVNKR